MNKRNSNNDQSSNNTAITTEDIYRRHIQEKVAETSSSHYGRKW